MSLIAGRSSAVARRMVAGGCSGMTCAIAYHTVRPHGRCLMPDRTTLKIGDRVRLLCVPSHDLEQRERERARGDEDAGWTADTIEQILALDPVVTIDFIDEYGQPWFPYDLTDDDGYVHEHHIALMEDESWEMA